MILAVPGIAIYYVLLLWIPALWKVVTPALLAIAAILVALFTADPTRIWSLPF